MDTNRFQDQKKRLSDFREEVWVCCPKCALKAIAKVDYESHRARLVCLSCSYNRESSGEISFLGTTGKWILPAHAYFDGTLWLQYPFKNEVFWAYNLAHLEYLERYIAAGLREHKDRSHFTLLEKLPRFYHEAKNRASLLRIIAQLKRK